MKFFFPVVMDVSKDFSMAAKMYDKKSRGRTLSEDRAPNQAKDESPKRSNGTNDWKSACKLYNRKVG